MCALVTGVQTCALPISGMSFVLCVGDSMVNPMNATINPPAIRRPGMEMPNESITHCPAKYVTSMTSRSEEHTSELQSLMRNSYAVFCLKKKNDKIRQTEHKHQTTHNNLEHNQLNNE